METKREIMLPHGALAKLTSALKVSEPTARKALRFQEGCNPDEMTLARKIRYNAVRQFGGLDTGAANMEKKGDICFWDYPNGARLAINIRSGFVTITYEGKVIDTADSITTKEIYDWQLKAENLRA